METKKLRRSKEARQKNAERRLIRLNVKRNENDNDNDSTLCVGVNALREVLPCFFYRSVTLLLLSLSRGAPSLAQLSVPSYQLPVGTFQQLNGLLVAVVGMSPSPVT